MRCGIEPVEGGAVVLALLQDRVPAQAGLRAFEHKKFEQNAVVVLGHAPLFIVIADGERVAGPAAADKVGGFGFMRELLRVRRASCRAFARTHRV